MCAIDNDKKWDVVDVVKAQSVSAQLTKRGSFLGQGPTLIADSCRSCLIAILSDPKSCPRSPSLEVW